jgi:hypothetical protein
VKTAIKHAWRNNGLSIVVFALFIAFWIGQTVTGWHHENDTRIEHHEPPITLSSYLRSGSFVEVTAENWESEFLQMFTYVVFTTFLFQRGSAESKSPDEPESESRPSAKSPSPVKKGGIALKLYERSLSLAFLFLFVVSFVMHAMGGAANYSEELMQHGSAPVTTLEYLATSRFWFESFQNWQSEFLALGAMVVLSIFLRQRGSPESKPVEAPHSQTGG